MFFGACKSDNSCGFMWSSGFSSALNVYSITCLIVDLTNSSEDQWMYRDDIMSSTTMLFSGPLVPACFIPENCRQSIIKRNAACLGRATISFPNEAPKLLKSRLLILSSVRPAKNANISHGGNIWTGTGFCGISRMRH